METTSTSLRDPDRWKSFFPDFHISDNKGFHFDQGKLPIDSDQLARVVESIAEDGYFKSECRVESDLLYPAVTCMEKLISAGLNEVWGFIYDEFWELMRSSKIHEYVRSILGPGYMQLPDFWALHVRSGTNDQGFAPHPDASSFLAVDHSGMPRALTVWLALTDATTDNGCLYLLPGNVAKEQNYPFGANISGNQYEAVCHRTKALPIQAGGFVGWNHHIIHWGSRLSRFEQSARFSISMEFIRGDVDPREHPHSYDTAGRFVPPISISGVMPSFEDRLRLVSQKIQQYGRHGSRFQGSMTLSRNILKDLG